MYKKSKIREKQDKSSEEYWFQKHKDECKFVPKINKSIGLSRNSVYDVKGLDKVKERMEKAREEAEFKKRMTERSTFSATIGVQKAK
jgi:hypothetical protein